MIPGWINTHRLTDDQMIILDAMALEARRIIKDKLNQYYNYQEGKDYGSARGVEVDPPPLSVELPFVSSRPTLPDSPTPLPSYAACPDRTAPRDVVLWTAGCAPAGTVPKGRLNFRSADFTCKYNCNPLLYLQTSLRQAVF